MDVKNMGSSNLHCLWNTRDWEPQLENDAVREELFSHLQNRALMYGVDIDRINGSSEHVHCLFLNANKEDISTVIRMMKKDANKWLKEKGHLEVKWERDYFVFPVTSDEKVNEIRKFIENQTVYHKLYSFAQELNYLIQENVKGN